MRSYNVILYWKDGGTSNFVIQAISGYEAERKVLDDLSGTQLDNVDFIDAVEY